MSSSQTAFTALRLGLVAVFKDAPSVAGVRITSGHVRPAISQYPSRVDVQLVNSKGTATVAGNKGPRTWVTTFAVTGLVRAAPGDTPDEELDTLLAVIGERIDTLDARALGAIAIELDLDPGIKWGVIEAAGNPTFSMVQRLIKITHRTQGAALSALTT